MRQDGHRLQQALFAALQADDGLAARFTLFAGDAALPQFSYDGMRSRWRDRPLQLVEHRTVFSVWAEQAGLQAADALAAQVSTALGGLSLMPPLRLVDMRLLQIDEAPDRASRLWQQQLSYEFVTGRSETP